MTTAGRFVGQTAVGIAAAVRAGRATPTEVLEQHLERIAALDHRVGAFRLVRAAEVRAEARALQGRGDLAGLPLAGVPVAIKDNIDLAGAPTRNGSAATSQEPAAADAELVRRLRDAGALLVGKTSVPELCLWPFTESEAFGVSRNPWSPDHTPGGTSGGSAAAVAAAMVPLALAADGGGSIRMPASNCGLVGIKPGLGVVPFPEGGVSTWSKMSEFGPLATTVADLGLLLDVLAGTDAHRAVAPPTRPLRIGVSAKPAVVGVRVHPEVRAAMEATAEALREAGHQVAAADPPWRNGDAGPILRRVFLGCAEDTDNLRWDALERRTRAEARVGRLLRRLRPAPSGPPARVLARYDAWFEDHDVLLTPTLAAPPLRIGAYQGKGLARTLLGMTAYMPFCPPLNLVGFPAASVPAGTTTDGLPLGAQLAAARGGEALLLSLARQLETLRPWPRHAPLEPVAVPAPGQRS
ncbi:MAG TPA: amidase family protein [Actinomycetes bacterium]|jgi:amidase|nr:amidase family protein [Actinomycetes bacterium]